MANTEHLGMGVMINMLSNQKESLEAYMGAVGKTIASVEMKNDALFFSFMDGSRIRLYDDGQSCCESRYMTTDDDLSVFVGAEFKDVEIREAPSVPVEYGDHDVEFLVVNTSRGSFTVETHNEHNGYYGGFYVKVQALPKENL